MNITREDMPGRQVALTIELEPDIVNTALEHAYRQMVNQVNVPGFRRGKAPRYILESYVGRDMLAERAVKNILPQTVQDAIAEQNIEAMDVGDVEIINMEPLQVRVIVVQPPVVEVGDYSDLRVAKETTEVTQEQVDEVLTGLRRESAPWNEPAEARPINEGDMVYLDLEGFTNEGPLEEAKRENFPTIVGMVRGGVPDVVNKALVGMSVGEEKDIADTLPEDYPVEPLRGHEVTYHVAVRSMKEQQLAELNDEFAKPLGYDSAQALHDAVESNLKHRVEEAAESNQVNTAISQLVERSTVEVPDVMVHEELDLMLKRLEERLKEQRITTRQYFTYNGTTEEQWREANHERAHERVIRGLVLHEFAHREGISVDEEEIEHEVGDIVERFEGQEKEQARTVLEKEEARTDLEDQIFQRKIVDRLVGIAEGKIEAAKPEAPEAVAEPEAQGASETGPVAQETPDAGATALEPAGGAAEVLSTQGVDVESPNETGEAPGGGTPETAPALRAKSRRKK